MGINKTSHKNNLRAVTGTLLPLGLFFNQMLTLWERDINALKKLKCMANRACSNWHSPCYLLGLHCQVSEKALKNIFIIKNVPGFQLATNIC